MKFWEAMKALDDRKKVRRKIWAAPSHWELDDTIVYHFNEEELKAADWEIYEEAKPEIRITADHVGRKVKLSDGAIAIINYFNSEYKQLTIGGSNIFYEQNGKTHASGYPDIVEILPEGNRTGWRMDLLEDEEK